MTRIINDENKILTWLFSFLILLGLVIFKDFGLSWDETISRTNGLLALEYVYNLLGKEFNLEINSIYKNSEDLSFKNYNDNHYGVVFDLPLAFIEYLFEIKDPQKYYFLRHIFNYLIFLIGSFYFFLILRNFYNFKLSLLGLIFLILSPRIFAESFYNNKDIVFLSFFCISTYYGFNFLKQKTLKELIKFSFFSALATGVRLAGLLIPVLIMFFYIIQLNEKNKKELTKNVILYSLIILFFTYLFRFSDQKV